VTEGSPFPHWSVQRVEEASDTDHGTNTQHDEDRTIRLDPQILTWSTTMCLACSHTPLCPIATAPDHDAARVISRHSAQGWSLLCNGVVLFDDTGEILPDGRTVAPHRPLCRIWTPAA
jgi:hypothetical protein